jgi:hypothetical protein
VSLGDVFASVKDGGPDSIFLLLLFITLWLAGKIYAKREIDYRDLLIERQAAIIDRQQASFDDALKLIREDLVPLARSYSERR